VDLRHLILTRFNVPSPGREAEIRLRPGWLDQRVDLFRRYCLPGVAAQTETAFEWIVVFDEQTPRSWRDEIAGLQDTFPFRAHFTDRYLMADIAPALAAAAGMADWLLTTRLDSDDILAADFVRRLQERARVRRRRVINFDRGVILSPARPPARYETEDGSNPFASLLEPADGPVRTIWGENHLDISRLGELEHVRGRPAWMQVVHGGNVANEIRGRRVPLGAHADLFPSVDLRGDAAAERPSAILGENLVRRPARLVRRRARAVSLLPRAVRKRLAGFASTR
jgi:putative rhamnosyltransferase